MGLGRTGKASRCAGRNNSTTTGVKTRQPKKHEAEQPHEIRDRSENEREIRTGKDRKHAENAKTATETGRARQLGGPPGASITTKGGPHDCKTGRRKAREPVLDRPPLGSSARRPLGELGRLRHAELGFG